MQQEVVLFKITVTADIQITSFFPVSSGLLM